MSGEAAERGGDRDHRDVEALGVVVVGGREIATGSDRLLQLLRRDVIDVRLTGVQSGDPHAVDIESDDGHAHLHGAHGYRKPDISLTDDDSFHVHSSMVWANPAMGVRRGLRRCSGPPR